jgi:hypothetical protein
MSYLTQAGVEEIKDRPDTITTIKHANGMIMTNGQLGGWTQQKNGDLVSIEYAKSLNRQQRRKRGIRL